MMFLAGVNNLIRWFLMCSTITFYYTFYTRTTHNGEIFMSTYVDLRENLCKCDFVNLLHSRDINSYGDLWKNE